MNTASRQPGLEGPRPLQPPAPGANVAFVLGSGRPGTALLYKLLCLHPQIAFICRLENNLPWLPVVLTGRLRLHRYSSKLRYWFRERDNGFGSRRVLARQLRPVAGDRVFAHCGLVDGAAWQHPPERVVTKLRKRFSGLQKSAGASLVVSNCGANEARIPMLHEIFPDASYLEVVRDPGDATTTRSNGHCLNGAGRPAGQAARPLAIRYEDLVSEPIEQMRQVQSFLGLERRLDYEWALKALKLGHAPAVWHAPRTARLDLPVDRAEREPLARSGYAP